MCLEPECAQLLCSSCSIHTHKRNHTLVGLTEKLNDLEMEQQRDSVFTQRQNLESFHSEILQIKTDVEEKADQLQQNVEERVQELVQTVIDMGEEFKQKIQEATSQEVKNLTVIQKDIDQLQKDSQEILNWIESRPDGTVEESLEDMKSYLSRHDQLNKSCAEIKTREFKVKDLHFREPQEENSLNFGDLEETETEITSLGRRVENSALNEQSEEEESHEDTEDRVENSATREDSEASDDWSD